MVATVMLYLWFGDDDVALINLSLPTPIDEAAFDHRVFERALLELRPPTH